jgi:FAD-dependent oxidoreductase domain-containing protein 1
MRHAGQHLQVLGEFSCLVILNIKYFRQRNSGFELFPGRFYAFGQRQRRCGEITRCMEDANVSFKNMIANRTFFRSKGVKVAFYTPEEARQKFPFINFDGISAVTYGKLFIIEFSHIKFLGLENEGFYDPWQLLSALREKNITLGVLYVQGEVEGFRFHKDPRFSDAVGIEADIKSRRISGAYFRPKMSGSSARPIETYQIINCAGPWSGQICEMAGIGNFYLDFDQFFVISGKGTGVLSVPIPIKHRKRTYFILHAPDVPGLYMPAIRDPSGVFCRPYEPGQTFICGRVPTKVSFLVIAIC